MSRAPSAAGLTLLSCAAFLALPFAAPQGSPGLFLGLTLLWSLSSSALRAPPLALLGRHVQRPAQPAMLALSMLGLGLANACAPYLGLWLRGVDPRGPFVLASVALAAATLGLAGAERALAVRRDAGEADPAAAPPPARSWWPVFAATALIAALAFQLHTFVNASPLYLRLAGPAQLPWLAPLFWVGFNLALWPRALPARRWGALRVLAGAAAVAAGLAGAAWAGLLNSAFAAALLLGHVGREGRFSASLSALLAAAALTRLALGVARAPGTAAATGVWIAAPPLLWLLVAGLAAAAAGRVAAPVAPGAARA